MSCVFLGLDPDNYWSLTPREILLRCRGARRRLRAEHNERMTQAFWTALLPNMKTPPTLKELLVEIDEQPSTPQDWRAIKAALMVAMPPEEPTST